MVQIYVRRIQEGRMTLTQVPQYWREGVRALLEAQ